MPPSQTAAPPDPAQTRTEIGFSPWSRTLLLLLFVIVGILAVCHETVWSIVSIWMRSDTFAHGFLIVPISLWLVWEKRVPLLGMHPQPAIVPLFLMVPVGFTWLMGNLVDVLVVQQFAFVGLLILGIWSVLGTPATRLLAFPIGFLLMGVPVGEGLIYPMMNFTADFTVAMLRLTGIPVFRDGTFFSIPSGDWSVVEACSGMRYLIASVTLGLLYAYLTYTKLYKRLIFVAVSVVVPILANGFRAYMIVMIGHLSDMKLAVGVDHLIYGWVFFGIIILILFSIGAIWRDPPKTVSEMTRAAAGGATASAPAIAPAVALAAVVVAGLWPGLAWTLARGEGDVAQVLLRVPAATAGWQAQTNSLWDWRPHVVGADGELYTFYMGADRTPVGLYLGVYKTQRQGAELLNSQNQMVVQKHPLWSDKQQSSRRIQLQGEAMDVDQSRLSSRRGEHLLVWKWYRIGERHISNPYFGKVIEALSRLFGRRPEGTLIAIAAPYEAKPEPAARTLQAFVDEMLPSIEQELNRALQQSP